MSRQRVLDLESEFHFLLSRSKASEANTGIIGILSHFEKNSNGCRREASGTHTTGEYFLVTVFVDRTYICMLSDCDTSSYTMQCSEGEICRNNLCETGICCEDFY